MLFSIGLHMVRFTLMAVAVVLIIGGGVYFGFVKSSRQRSSRSSSRDSSTSARPPGSDRPNDEPRGG
jgi:hypothetical protein